jgi:hypothetical protein
MGLPHLSSTKVELTRPAEWRIVLLRGDLTPALLVRPKAVLGSNRCRLQSSALL